jgi:hypothetical protein
MHESMQLTTAHSIVCPAPMQGRVIRLLAEARAAAITLSLVGGGTVDVSSSEAVDDDVVDDAIETSERAEEENDGDRDGEDVVHATTPSVEQVRVVCVCTLPT